MIDSEKIAKTVDCTKVNGGGGGGEERIASHTRLQRRSADLRDYLCDLTMAVT